jgi:hypothetical protein
MPHHPNRREQIKNNDAAAPPNDASRSVAVVGEGSPTYSR